MSPSHISSRLPPAHDPCWLTRALSGSGAYNLHSCPHVSRYPDKWGGTAWRRIGCRGRSRTCYLLGMNQVSYRCSTLLQTPQTGVPELSSHRNNGEDYRTWHRSKQQDIPPLWPFYRADTNADTLLSCAAYRRSCALALRPYHHQCLTTAIIEQLADSGKPHFAPLTAICTRSDETTMFTFVDIMRFHNSPCGSKSAIALACRCE